MNIATDPHAHLRAAFGAGCRIQAWHLNDGAANSNDGRWDTLTPPEGREPEFGCAPHLYRVHQEDEAEALAAWDFRMPTMHQPDGVRFYIERLVSNTDPAGMVRENLLLRETVEQLSAQVAETQALERDGFVLVPRELTAENGAKAALIGEVEVRLAEGSPWVPVSWTAIKELHRKMVAHFAGAAASGGSDA